MRHSDQILHRSHYKFLLYYFRVSQYHLCQMGARCLNVTCPNLNLASQYYQCDQGISRRSVTCANWLTMAQCCQAPPIKAIAVIWGPFPSKVRIANLKNIFDKKWAFRKDLDQVKIIMKKFLSRKSNTESKSYFLFISGAHIMLLSTVRIFAWRRDPRTKTDRSRTTKIP